MTFETALAHVLIYEGGYSDNPNDPGGPTNLGITWSEWAVFKGTNASFDEFKNLRPFQVAPIYRRDYWDAMNCETLPDALRLMVFDCAVNQGPHRAAEFLDKSSEFGHDPILQKEYFAKLRSDHYWNLTQNPKFHEFGKGWYRRLVSVCCLN